MTPQYAVPENENEKPKPRARYPRPSTPRRSIRVRPELWTKALDKAHENNETVTEVVVRALQEYVK